MPSYRQLRRQQQELEREALALLGDLSEETQARAANQRLQPKSSTQKKSDAARNKSTEREGAEGGA